MIWGCITCTCTWYGPGTFCMVNGNINAEKDISNSKSDDHQYGLLLYIISPNNYYTFQDDNAPRTSSPHCRNIWLGRHLTEILSKVQRTLQNRADGISTPDKLFKNILNIWTNLSVLNIKTSISPFHGEFLHVCGTVNILQSTKV